MKEWKKTRTNQHLYAWKLKQGKSDSDLESEAISLNISCHSVIRLPTGKALHIQHQTALPPALTLPVRQSMSAPLQIYHRFMEDVEKLVCNTEAPSAEPTRQTNRNRKSK